MFKKVQKIPHITAHFWGVIWGRGLNPYEGVPQFEQEGFASYYEANIKDYVRQYEARRIKALKKTRKRFLTFVPLYLLIVAACVLYIIHGVNTPGEDVEFAFWGIIAATAIFYGFVRHYIRRYKKRVKGRIFPVIFRYFGESYSYSADVGYSIDTLKPWGIVPDYDRVNTEDLVRGSYKDVAIELFEAHLQKESRDKDNKRRYHTVFKGLCITLSVNKNFRGKTVIVKDRGIFNIFAKNRHMKGLSTVKLEDPHFEKKFEVFSNDQIEARYLLTTSFMKRLMDLVEILKAKGVQCSFYKEKLLIMLPAKKNFFEPGSIFEPATFEHDIKTILEEMKIIFDIVDILKLNQNIGL